jgi:UDP-N-acetylmuramoyl-tripeptide--D-alanyl-D-alanine ligase
MNLESLHAEFLLSEGVSTDTRHPVRGTLFFALKGERFDGNRYVGDALAAGCRLAVTDSEAIRGRPGTFYTPSVVKLLQDLAAYHRRYLSTLVIAITGSNGKTTTKELAASILSRKFRVQATRGNLNNHIGVPLTLLSLREEEVAVVEMGANHPGEIRELAWIAAPELGMVTNAGKAHLEGFGSVEGVLSAKAELYEYLARSGGKALVDGEERALLGKAAETGVETLVVAPGGEIPVRAILLGQDPYLEVGLEIGGTTHQVKTQLVGAYNLQNIRMAAAAGYHLGVPGKEIAGAVAAYRPGNQRSQLVEGRGNRVIMDSYNANPTSMREAISGLLDYSHPPKMLILGDMAELGGACEAEHRELVRWIETLSIDRVLLAGEFFSAAVEPKGTSLVFRSVPELCEHLRREPPTGFTILVKGSRVMQLERVLEYLT